MLLDDVVGLLRVCLVRLLEDFDVVGLLGDRADELLLFVGEDLLDELVVLRLEAEDDERLVVGRDVDLLGFDVVRRDEEDDVGLLERELRLFEDELRLLEDDAELFERDERGDDDDERLLGLDEDDERLLDLDEEELPLLPDFFLASTCSDENRQKLATRMLMEKHRTIVFIVNLKRGWFIFRPLSAGSWGDADKNDMCRQCADSVPHRNDFCKSFNSQDLQQRHD